LLFFEENNTHRDGTGTRSRGRSRYVRPARSVSVPVYVFLWLNKAPIGLSEDD